MPDQPKRNFADDNHALSAGYLLGVLIRSGVTAWPEVDDDNDYTPVMVIEVDDEQFVKVLVLPESGGHVPVENLPAPVYDALGQRVDVR